MKCDEVQRLFPLCAPDEGRPLLAWRVRRHLRTCSVCAREWQTSHRMGELLRAADVAPGRSSAVAIPGRVTPWNRLLLPGAATAIGGLLVFAGITLLAPGLPGNPSRALAEMESAMQKVRTAHWVEHEIVDPAGAGVRMRREIWIRFDPAAERIYQPFYPQPEGHANPVFDCVITPETGRRIFRDNTIQVDDRWRGLTPEQRRVLLRKQIKEEFWVVLPPELMKVGRHREEFGGGYSVSDWSLRRETLEGRPVIEVFGQIRSYFTRSSAKGQEAPPSDTVVAHVWADAATHRVLRQELKLSETATGRVVQEIVREQYRYDEPLDDSRFTLTVPRGTPVYHDELQKTPSAAALTIQERQTIQKLLDSIAKGWRKADWATMAPAWDARYASKLAPAQVPPGVWERYLKQRIVAQRGQWLEITMQINAIDKISYIRLPRFGDVDLPPGKKDELLRVTALTHLRSQERASWWVSELLTLRRVGAHDFRIVGWQSQGLR